jgi:Ca-activated chloride channel homolog
VIRSTAELVKLDAAVLDARGNFVSGLTPGDFRVLDGSLERPIRFFAPASAPVQILVLAEASPAVYLIHTQHLLAAYALLDGLAPDDQVALASYSDVPRPILALTPDKSALLAAISQMQYSLGSAQLNLFDSLSDALDWLAPAAGKKSIVVLSTGLDSSPPSHWDALVRKLHAQDAVIYAVALGGSLRHDQKQGKREKNSHQRAAATAEASESEAGVGFEQADRALNSLAAITGGRAYFPQSAGDFASIYREIASALRHQYVLGIAPAHDGKFHSITVEVVDGNQAGRANEAQRSNRVLVRDGYLAPEP